MDIEPEETATCVGTTSAVFSRPKEEEEGNQGKLGEVEALCVKGAGPLVDIKEELEWDGVDTHWCWVLFFVRRKLAA